jgi:alpha-L-fucosidase 2
MKKGLLLLLFPLLAKAQDDLKLWYRHPAAVWTEALPVGNGRLGAMVFGGIEKELLQLNESTLWSGGPVGEDINPASPGYLPKVREALFNNKYDEANALVKRMQGLYSESYLPLGDLVIEQNFNGNKPSAYYRDLNIQSAVATTRFTIEGITYVREVFVSAPDQLIIVRLSANKPGKLDVTVRPQSPLPFTLTGAADHLMLMKGKAPSHDEPNYVDSKDPIVYHDSSGCRGMRFALALKATTQGGHINSTNEKITITDATEIVLTIAAATSFNGYDKCPDQHGVNEVGLAMKSLSKASSKKYHGVLSAHLLDFQKYFNRVSLQLNDGKGSRTDLPTDERMELYNKTGVDPGLEALYFQYGRYLLISSSRTPGVPANLQGIWNKELRPPWSSNYTTNINLQMNYWPAEAGNLSEFVSPLIDLIRELSITGRRTAKQFYNLDGWVAHHNSDIWAMTNPVGNLGHGDPKWANWAMGANWLSRHLWEHYLYSGDKSFLKNTAYPIMKDAVIFTLNWLIADSSGHLVTAPSTSPENDYYYDNRKSTGLTIASTMDLGIIRDLLENTKQALTALNTDKAFGDTISTTLHLLYPFMIGSKGQLQEWYCDYEDVDPHHRHVSHLFALHPANLISPIKTPDLANAARKTLELRGDEGTGWSLAWKVNFWARLLDGDKAHALYANLLRLTKENNANYNRGGGAYANLFDAHPPFQIDGNFAGAAGLMEMLLQSQGGEIFLLPALPRVWKSGTVKGLVARGGYTVDITWENGEIKDAFVYAKSGGSCTIRTLQPVAVAGTHIVSHSGTIGNTITFVTEKGRRYQLKAR